MKLMSHLRQPPFRQYFPHSSGFFPPWEHVQNFGKKISYFSWDSTTPAERTSIWKNRPSRWRKCLTAELRIRPFLLVGDSLFSALKCGQKSNIFLDFWALLPDPEITSLAPSHNSLYVWLLFHNVGGVCLGRDILCIFPKKVVIWFEKLGLLCLAADTKRWSFASLKTAIPP